MPFSARKVHMNTARQHWSLGERIGYAISVHGPRWFFSGHVTAYRLSGGRIGGKMRDIPVLLLTTTGRKSGKGRTKALMYLRDGEDFVVAASNGGQPRLPAWWLNLRTKPAGSIQVRATQHAITAKQVPPEDRDRLWSNLVAMNPYYAEYQREIEHEIPVIRLQLHKPG